MSGTSTSAGDTRSSERIEVRGAVAVALSRFPTVTETFILREVDEMERQGQPVRLVPLMRDDPPVVHDAARSWVDRALFSPFVSGRILGANLRALFRDPRRYLSALGTLIRGTVKSPAFLLRSLAIFPKAVYLAGRLEEEGVRHVHVHYATHPATAGWVMASLSELTFSVTAHAHDIFVDTTFLEEKLQAASFVRVISDFNRRYLLSRFPGLDPERIQVVHAGIDVQRIEAEVERRRDGDAKGPPLIACVASLRPYKGISVLLNACRSLRDAGVSFRLELAGDGPERAALESRVAEHGLGDRVRFLGAVSEEGVTALLARASIFVLPSVVQRDGQMEGIPVALMEAMASGLPVVTSELSGIPELVVDGESGLLVTPGDADGVAGAVCSLIRQPERARRMGERGREVVRDSFELEGCVQRLRELLHGHEAPVERAVRDRLRGSGALARHTATVGVRRVRESRDSFVAEVVLGGGARPAEAVMKIHRTRPGASRAACQRARTEFQVLRDLAQGNGEGGRVLDAPRPLHLEDGADWLLMTRCDGPSLLGSVKECRRTGGSEPMARASFLLRDTGAWLRGFQERSVRTGAAGESLDRAAHQIFQALDALAGDGLHADEVRYLTKRARALRAEAGTGPEVVLRHGDFRPGNVLVSREGRPVVIDFEGAEEGHPLEDPAHFVVHLGLYVALPGLADRRWTLERAFLDGYGLEWGDEYAAFRLLRAAVAARILDGDGVQGGARALRGFRRAFLLETLREVA